MRVSDDTYKKGNYDAKPIDFVAYLSRRDKTPLLKEKNGLQIMPEMMEMAGRLEAREWLITVGKWFTKKKFSRELSRIVIRKANYIKKE